MVDKRSRVDRHYRSQRLAASDNRAAGGSCSIWHCSSDHQWLEWDLRLEKDETVLKARRWRRLVSAKGRKMLPTLFSLPFLPLNEVDTPQCSCGLDGSRLQRPSLSIGGAIITCFFPSYPYALRSTESLKSSNRVPVTFLQIGVFFAARLFVCEDRGDSAI